MEDKINIIIDRETETAARKNKKRKIKLAAIAVGAAATVTLGGLCLGHFGFFEKPDKTAVSSDESSEIKYFVPEDKTDIDVYEKDPFIPVFRPEISKVDFDAFSEHSRFIYDGNFIYACGCDSYTITSDGDTLGYLSVYKINVETGETQIIPTDYLVRTDGYTELVQVGNCFYGVVTNCNKDGVSEYVVVIKVDFESGLLEETSNPNYHWLSVSEKSQFEEQGSVFYDFSYSLDTGVLTGYFFDVETEETTSVEFYRDFLYSRSLYSCVYGGRLYTYVNNDPDSLTPYIAILNSDGTFEKYVELPNLSGFDDDNSIIQSFKVLEDFVYIDMAVFGSDYIDERTVQYYYRKATDNFWVCETLNNQGYTDCLSIADGKYLIIYNSDRLLVFDVKSNALVELDAYVKNEIMDSSDPDGYFVFSDVFANQNGDVILTVYDGSSEEKAFYRISFEDIEAAFRAR